MANVKISALPIVTSLSSTDVFPVVAGSATSKISLANLSNTLLTVPSASYALTASYALNGGTGGGSIATSGSTLYSTDPATGGGFSTVNSLFLGTFAGYQAHSASGSNFVGYQSGYGADRAYNSNMFGTDAGYTAYSASNSNFFGQQAGDQAFSAYNSNFLGFYAGKGAVDANNSNFFGINAGYLATAASDSNFFGQYAGDSATNAYSSNFFGYQAGVLATNSNDSNFFGNGAGQSAIDAFNSNFLGYQAGYQATNANNSNFLGYQAGYLSTDAYNSNFIGASAGLGATNAYGSNFIGTSTGGQAISANLANFVGYLAGVEATNAERSNFLGLEAGRYSINANSSNFIGERAGYSASNAQNSNFIGFYAGFEAANAAYCVAIGYQAGRNILGSMGSNNIVIGTNITLDPGRANSINLGGIIFATGSYSDINASTFSGSVGNGKVGINVVNPTTALHVSGTVSASAFIGDGSGLTNLPGGGGSVSQNIVTSSVPADRGIPSASYYFSLESNIPKQAGTISLVSGSNSIVGSNTYFLDDISGINTTDSFGIWVYDSAKSTWWNIHVYPVYSDTSANIFSVEDINSRIGGWPYTNNQYLNFPGTTGDYDYYIQKPFSTGYRGLSIGQNTFSTGSYSFAHGYNTLASGIYSHAEGYSNAAVGNYSHVEGDNNRAYASSSHAEGSTNYAYGNYSHAEGYNNKSFGNASHAEGINTRAVGRASNSKGIVTAAYGTGSNSEGDYTQAGWIGIPITSVSSGIITMSQGIDYSSIFYGYTNLYVDGKFVTNTYSTNYSDPDFTIDTGITSLNSGNSVAGASWIEFLPASNQIIQWASTIEGNYSHAEGYNSRTYGKWSHAEGTNTFAYGEGSHAEGAATIASGSRSHAEGLVTQAIGDYSHAEGVYTISTGVGQHVQGQYNLSSSVQSAFIIGNGIDDANRKNLVFAAGTQFQVTGSLVASGSSHSINGFVVLTQVSQSLNFTSDANAAAGGVPLGGLYRNGNAIQIRLT